MTATAAQKSFLRPKQSQFKLDVLSRQDGEEGGGGGNREDQNEKEMG